MANVLQNVVKATLGVPFDPAFKDEYPMLWDEANQRPVNRVQIQAFRGVGKSWVTSALTDWALGIAPHLNVLAGSAGKARADAFSTFTKRLISELDVLAPLKPDPEKGQRYSNTAFDVGPAPASHAPSVYSMGIFGQLTGGRADIIIADDVEVPNTSETQTMREKLEVRVQEFAAIRKPGGSTIYLGTPQCEDSLYCKLEARGYVRICWPARYPGPQWMKAHGYALAPMLKRDIDANPDLTTGGGLDGREGQPTDPERFSESDLQEREGEYGRSGFALQFMLDTTLADADRYPLKLSDWIVWDADKDLAPEHPVWASSPDLVVKDLQCIGFRGDRWLRPMQLKGEMIPFTGCIMAIDPAGLGPDELAYAILKHLNGFLYLAECKGLRGGYSPGNLQLLAERAKAHSVKEIVVEPNFGGGMFVELLKPVLRNTYPCTIKDSEWARGQKEVRIINTLEPVLNQHRLVVSRQVILEDSKPHPGETLEKGQSRQLFHQLTRITKEPQSLKHDDRIDALAQAVAAWTKSMAVDADVKKGEREWAEFHKSMKAGLDNRVIRKDKRRPPKRPSFLDRLMRVGADAAQ